MKVWIVWDPLHEKVLSVHKTERGAQEYCRIDSTNQQRDPAYWFNYDEFELEE